VDSYRGPCHRKHEFPGRSYWAGGDAASGGGGGGEWGMRGLGRGDMDALNSWLEDVHIRYRTVVRTLRYWPIKEVTHAVTSMSERSGHR
jgi:hypothetical protein